MDLNTDDFIVDTQGYCFLCLNQISEESNYAVHSIQYLSKYLKLDMSKVFQGPVPLHLLEKVQRSKLSVELCSECFRINEKFSKLFQKLEKIKIEMAFELNSISNNLKNSDKNGGIEELKKTFEKNHSSKSNNDDDIDALMGKLEIAQVLRNEANLACSTKLTICAQPQVKFEKMNQNKIAALETPRVQVENCSPPISNSDLSDSNNFDDPFEMNIPHESNNDSDDDDGNDNNDLIQFESKEIIETSLKPEDIPVAIKFIPNLKPDFLTNKRVINRNPKTGKFICSTCSKEFFCVPTLYRHFKSVHMKVRYNCPVCKKSFSQQVWYKAHYKNVHLGIRYKCKICGAGYSFKNTLLQHLKRLHN